LDKSTRISSSGSKVLRMVGWGRYITVLAVIFLIEAVQWESSIDILGMGLSAGAVIVSIAYFLRVEEVAPHQEG